MSYFAKDTLKHDWRQEFKRLEGAFAPSTLKSYFVNALIFETWCIKRNIQPFPAKVDTVADFLTEQGSTRKISTIRQRLYAIRKVHRLLRLPDPTQDEEISITLRRIRRAKPSRPKQAKGLTRVYRDQFMAQQPDTPWGLRSRTMIALGYDILARRSELVALQTDSVIFRDDGTARILIRRSKTDPFGHGRTAFTSCKTAQLLVEWLEWRKDDTKYLFCPIYQGKAINRSLSDTTVKRLIKEAAKRAGLPPPVVSDFSGHSMRVGAAQDLLSAGFDTAAIMRAGGWKSVEVLARYLENAEHNVWESSR